MEYEKYSTAELKAALLEIRFLSIRVSDRLVSPQCEK
jgi:hypothetical protein